MADWPRRYHRARVQGEGYVPAGGAVVEGYQLTPGTWLALAAWCSGERVLDLTGNQAVVLPGGGLLRLGDVAVRDGDRYAAERADGFYQRFILAD